MGLKDYRVQFGGVGLFNILITVIYLMGPCVPQCDIDGRGSFV